MGYNNWIINLCISTCSFEAMDNKQQRSFSCWKVFASNSEYFEHVRSMHIERKISHEICAIIHMSEYCTNHFYYIHKKTKVSRNGNSNQNRLFSNVYLRCHCIIIILGGFIFMYGPRIINKRHYSRSNISFLLFPCMWMCSCYIIIKIIS